MFLNRTFTVKSVESTSPADTLGFRAGDRIVRIAGLDPVSERFASLRQLLKMGIGAEATFLVNRDGKQKVLTVPLEK